MKIFIRIVIFLISFWGFAQTPDTLFQNANTAFKNGKFDQAIESYNKILASGYESADLYYNLGNAYYKLNEIAPGIYYFNKALLLQPNHEDAKNNLAFAQRMTIDVIEPLPQTFFQRINEKLIYSISYNTWAVVSVWLALITAVLIMAYFYTPLALRKKWYFSMGIVSFILFLIVLSMGMKAKYHYNHDQPAIVFAKEIAVKSEPTNQSSTSFVLHEGAKVNVVQQDENWFKITIADGKFGWLPNEAVKKLKD